MIVFPCSGMFWDVPGCSGMFRDVPGCSGMFRDVPGCSGMFRDVPGCSGMFRDVPGCSGMFRDVPGCSGTFRDVPCSWFYRRPSWSNPRQTRILLHFQLSVVIKALLKQISLYLLSQFHIRIIALTCPDNKSARNHQPKSCVPKSHKSRWCEANIISVEISSPVQFVPVRVETREYHH